MNALQSAIAQIVNEAVLKAVAAIRTASFQDVASLAAPQAQQHQEITAAPVRPRPSSMAPQSAVTTARVKSLLTKYAGGMKAEDIRSTLGIDKPAVVKLLQRAMAEGAVYKTGQKRATMYFASGAEAQTPTVVEYDEEIENPAEVLAAVPGNTTPQQNVIRRPKKSGGATVLVIPQNYSET